MDINPYQSPRSDDQMDAATDLVPRQRSWSRIWVGSSCVGISLFLVAISPTAPQEIPRRMLLMLFMGGIASSFAVMGAGIFLRRDKLAIAGLALLALLITVIAVGHMLRR